MPNWAVSCHGGIEKKGWLRRKLAPTKKFKYGVTYVPSGIELMMFTAQNEIFYDGEINLQYLLAGNEAGLAPYVHKIKAAYKIIPDYRAYGTNDFESGIYLVGGGGRKIYNFPNGCEIKLSAILQRAKSQGVSRVYWLACTEFL